MAIRFDDILKVNGGTTKTNTATTVQSQANQAEAQRRRQEEEKRRRQQEEKKRQEEQRRKQEAERKRKQEEERKRKQEEQRKADQERQRKQVQSLDNVKKNEMSSAQQTNYERLLSAREKAGGNLVKNTGTLAFGNNWLGEEANKHSNDLFNGIKEYAENTRLRPEEYESTARARGYTDEEIANAKRVWQEQRGYEEENIDNQQNRSMKGNNRPNPIDITTGYKRDNWMAFLPDKDQNLAERTLNDIRSGFMTNQQGLIGLGTAVQDATGKTHDNDYLDAYNYIQNQINQANAGNPQTMYDRIVSNTVNNGLNAMETAVAGALGAPAQAAGLGIMGANVFGNSYGQVRTGQKGDEYANDLGAATRYGLANAGSELAQELVDPFHFVPGAGTPTLGNFLGEMGQEGVGAILDPYLETVIGNDPLSNPNQWAHSMLDTLGDQYLDENGNFSGQKAMQRVGDIAKQGFEGGLGSIAGSAATNPVGTAQQIGADVRSIAEARDAKQAIDVFDNLKADYDVARNGASRVDEEVAKFNTDRQLDAMRSYVQTGLRSFSDQYREIAGEANRRIAEYTGEERGVSRETIGDMVDISNRLGVGFEFTDANNPVLNGNDAVYDNGRILINAKSENPYATLFAHEMTHSTEGSNEYRKYAGQLDNLVDQGVIDDVNLNGPERYAVLTERLLENDRTLKDVAEYDGSVVRYLAGQLRDTFTGNTRNRAINKTMRALDQAIEQAKYQERDRTEYYTKKALAETYPVTEEGKQAYRSTILPNEVAKFIHGYDTTPNRAKREAEKIIKLARTNGGLDEDILADYVDEQIERDPDYSMIDVSDYEQVENLSKVWEDYTNFFTEEGRAEMLAEEVANEIIQRAEQEEEKKEEPKPEEPKPADEAKPVQEEKKEQPKPVTPSANTNTLQGALQKNLKISAEHVDAVVKAMDDNGGKADPALIDKLISEGVTELNKQSINRLNAAYDYYNDSRILSGEKKRKDIFEVEKEELKKDNERRKAINPMSEELQKRINLLKQKGEMISEESNKLKKVKGANFYVLDNGEFTGETVKDVMKGIAKSFKADYSLISSNRSAAEIEEIIESLEKMYDDYQDVKNNGYESKYFKEQGLSLAAKNANSKLHKELKEEAERWAELDEEERDERQDRREAIVYGKLFEESDTWKNMSDAEKLEATRRAMREEAIQEEDETEEVETPAEEKVETPAEEKVEAPAEEESYNPDSMYEDDYDEEAIAAADAEARAEEATKEEVKEPEVAAEEKPVAEEVKADETLAGIFKDNGVSDELSTALTTDFNGNFIKAKEQLSKATGLGYKAAEKVLKDIKKTYDDGMAKGHSIEEINKAINEKLDQAKELDLSRKEQKRAVQDANKEAYKKSKETATEEVEPATTKNETLTSAEQEVSKTVDVEKEVEKKKAEKKKARKEAKAKAGEKATKAKQETAEEKTVEDAVDTVTAEAEVKEDIQDKVDKAFLEKEFENRNTGDMSKQKTSERALKSKVIDEKIKAIIRESYEEKEVVEDRNVNGTADEMFNRFGVEGAVKLAENVTAGESLPTVEKSAYFYKAIIATNAIASKCDGKVEAIRTAADAKDIEIDVDGFKLKDGSTVDTIEANGEKYTFEDYSTLKDIAYQASQDGDKCIGALNQSATEAGRLLRYMRFMYPGASGRGNRLINQFITALEKENQRALNGKTLTVSDELREKFINAKNNNERRDIMNLIEDELARQIPATNSEKLRQWRMTAMLLNPRTHVRNFVSNAMTYGMFRLTDQVQSVVENCAEKWGWIDKSDRQATAGKIGADYREFAEITRKTTGYTRDVSDRFDIRSGRMRVGSFKTNLLNKISSFNSEFLQKADDYFINRRADVTLAQELIAQGYEIQDKDGVLTAVDPNTKKAISQENLEKMMDKALQSAEEATYHDFSDLANTLNKFKQKPGLGHVLDIVVPFTKTPANILRRSIEYTPAGLAKNLTFDLAAVKDGKMSASEAITKFSRGMTGSMLMTVGVALAKMGLLTSPDDDDEETTYYKENIFGKQDYALHIGDRYYSLDWAYPSITPLVIGAQLANSGDNILKSLTIGQLNALEPILEASYLQSVSDLIQNAEQGFNYGGELTDGGIAGALERVGFGVAESLVGQMVPTVFGAFNRTVDSTKRTTSGNTFMERAVNKAKMSIPGMSFTLEPAIDQKGEVIKYPNITVWDHVERAFNNFANPATVSYDTHDSLDEELVRIGRKAVPKAQSGQNGLRAAIKSDLTQMGHNLNEITGKDYTKVKQTYYGNYNQYVKDYNDLAAYNNLGKEVRDKVYGKLDNLALAEAKLTYYDKVGGNPSALLTDEQKVALALKKQGISPAEFFLMKQNGLSGNRGALYSYQELNAMGGLDTVVNGIKKGEYSATAAGLNEGILKKTALQRDDMTRDFLGEDLEGLESQAATYRLQKGTEAYENELALKKSKDSADHLEELNDDIYTKTAKEEFFEDRAIKAGLTGKQFYDYHDIDGDKGEDGKYISGSRNLKVTKQMMDDGTWASYKEAYEKGDIDKNDLSKLHLTESMMTWSDNAIEEAIKALDDGTWTGTTDFKSAYKKAHGVAVTGKTSSSGGSKKSSSSKSSSKSSSASSEQLLKAFTKAMSSGTKNTGKVKSKISRDSATLFDKIVNGSDSDIEKLRRELGL